MGFLGDVKNARLTAAELVEARMRMGQLPIRGGRGMTTETDGVGGTVLHNNPPAVRVEDIRVGMIADAGPAGEADYDDERYHVATQKAAAGSRTDRLALSDDVSNYADESTVTASSLAEWAEDGGTHNLAVGTPVLIYGWEDDNGVERYVFDRSPPAVAAKFATLTEVWPEFSDHNKVTLTPCVSELDDTPTGDPDLEAYIQLPLGSTPSYFALDVGDIIDYYTTAAGTNVLLHVPFPGSNTLYDVPHITALVDAKGVGGSGSVKAKS